MWLLLEIGVGIGVDSSLTNIVYKLKLKIIPIHLLHSWIVHNLLFWTSKMLSQIRYLLVVILELNDDSEVQYKDMMMVDDGKYQ